MPDEDVYIHMDWYNATPLDIDLSNGPCSISYQDYSYIVSFINSGWLRAELRAGSLDEYNITLSDGSEIGLTPTTVYSYDYDYAPCYSISLPNGSQKNPLNIIFAENYIRQGTLDLTMPKNGDPWDWETMKADLVPGDEDWNVGRFTVPQATWYDTWGLSAFTQFEGGNKYFVGFTIAPNEGYYLTPNSEMVIRVKGSDRTISIKPLYMNEDGSAYYSFGQKWDQIMLVGGDLHTITVNNGYASLNYRDSANSVVVQAVPGQEIYIRSDVKAAGEGNFIVWGSVNATSDDVEVLGMELVDVYEFYMPNHDVTIDVTFDTAAQKEVTLDLTNGSCTVVNDGTPQSESTGVQVVLQESAVSQSNSDGTWWFDIDRDANNTWDVQRSGETFTLLPTSSLTHNTTLRPERSVTGHWSVSAVNIKINNAQKHSINIVGGGYASSHELHCNSNDAIVEAYPGDWVYVAPDESLLDGEFIDALSVQCTSDDATISSGNLIGIWCFEMPDHDVTATSTYNTYPLQDVTLDLYNGPVTVSNEGSPFVSVAGGVFNTLSTMSANNDITEGGQRMYDVDGDGSWDVLQNSNVFSLAPTNSLTKNVTLTRSDTHYYSVRSVTLQVVERRPHTITIIGGVASTVEDDFFNEHVITEACEGDTVFVVPRTTDIDDDSYIAQGTQEATSNDVTIDDVAGISFTMPNKDVTVRYDYECYVQDVSIMDFRYTDTVTIADDGTGARSEVYGVSMLLCLLAANTEYVPGIYRFDIDGDGGMDVQMATAAAGNTFSLLSTNSLPAGGVYLTLSRAQSWTLPIRSLSIVTPTPFIPVMHGDVDGDGTITIQDATLLQRVLCEFTNDDGTPLLDLNDPDVFFRCDANNDGYVNVCDLTAIQRHLAGIDIIEP